MAASNFNAPIERPGFHTVRGILHVAVTAANRITDHGPYRRGRIIGVSRAAARELDMIERGTTLGSIECQ
jgi:hypothetical protein